MTCDPRVFSLLKLVPESADKNTQCASWMNDFFRVPCTTLTFSHLWPYFPSGIRLQLCFTWFFPFPNANDYLSKQWTYRWQKKEDRFHWDLLLWRIFHLNWISKMELPFSLCELQSQPWEVDLKQSHLERLTAQRTWGHLGDGSCRYMGVTYYKEERP